MNYLKLLLHSHEMITDQSSIGKMSKLEYLSEFIFDFTTYDSEISELFAKRGVEVCQVIVENKTFEYIKNEENYKWFLIMVNMSFFNNKLEWGTSIRGAWWYFQNSLTFESCGLFKERKQIMKIKFDIREWKKFILAMIDFIKEKQLDQLKM